MKYLYISSIFVLQFIYFDYKSNKNNILSFLLKFWCFLSQLYLICRLTMSIICYIFVVRLFMSKIY